MIILLNPPTQTIYYDTNNDYHIEPSNHKSNNDYLIDHLCHHLEEGEGDHFFGHVDHLVEDDCDRAVVVLDLAHRGCVEVVLDREHAEVVLDNRQQAGDY